MRVWDDKASRDAVAVLVQDEWPLRPSQVLGGGEVWTKYVRILCCFVKSDGRILR